MADGPSSIRSLDRLSLGEFLAGYGMSIDDFIINTELPVITYAPSP